MPVDIRRPRETDFDENHDDSGLPTPGTDGHEGKDPPYLRFERGQSSTAKPIL